MVNWDIYETAKNKALRGGVAGASAMIFQVSSLMWLRTTMNYQYAHGGSFSQAWKTLYKQGGLLRFYKGYPFGIIQGPLSRFGDTAANMGILELTKETNLPIALRTGLASLSAGAFRIIIMPIDALKTTLQVQGKDAMKILNHRISISGYRTLWNGSLATASATLVGHYPWFMTYNYLNAYWPQYDGKVETLARQAGIGFSASIVSDTCSNSLRVIKTGRQTYHRPISYTEVTREIIKKDGLSGLFLRGLDTRILANGLNGMLFSVLWKHFMDMKKEEKSL